MHQLTLWILFLPSIVPHPPFVKSCLHGNQAFQSTRRLNNPELFLDVINKYKYEEERSNFGISSQLLDISLDQT